MDAFDPSPFVASIANRRVAGRGQTNERKTNPDFDNCLAQHNRVDDIKCLDRNIPSSPCLRIPPMDPVKIEYPSTTRMGEYLCQRCMSFQIDFLALWTGKSTSSTYDHYALGTLESILERSYNCGLCRLAIRCFDLRGPKSPLKHPGGKDRTITLYCKGIGDGEGQYDLSDQFEVRDRWPVFSMEMDSTPSRPGSSDEYLSNCRILPCGEDLFGTLSLDSRPNLTTFYGRSPAPTITQFPTIKGWLNECIESHGSACDRPMLFPDFQKRSSLSRCRMIDLRDWCLVDISPTSHRFFAMSYAWGATVQYRTLQSNFCAAHKPGYFREILKDLSATIRDTMILLVALGERYLWCDSLCIIQDSMEDWSYWAAHMNEIYESAFSVVIARSGTHSNAGLFDVGHPWHTEERVADNLRLISVPIIEQEKKHGMAVLETRGWILQEQLFASRMLVFTNGLVSFQCNQSIRRQDVALEALAYPASNSVVHDLLKLDWGFDYRVSSGVDFGTRTSNMFYNDCLITFSQRQFAFESDRLPAFLGIANLIASQIDTELFLGFPIATFNLTILWRTYDEDATLLSDEGRKWKRTEPMDLVPTWCWASWTGKKTTLNVGDDDDTKSTWAISTYEKEFFRHTWIVWYCEDLASSRPLRELSVKSSRGVSDPQKHQHSNSQDYEVNLSNEIFTSESHLNPGIPHYTPPTPNTFRRYCGESVSVASLGDQYSTFRKGAIFAGYGALHFYTLCATFEFALCQARCRRAGLGEQATRLFAFRDKHGIPCGVFDMELGAGRHFPPDLLGKQDVIAISEDRSNRSRLDYWVGETTYLDNLRRKTEIESPPSGRSWPLFTIMVVEWKDGIAYRKAPYIGRICQVAFEASLEPAEWKHVILK